jgi:hypothetical protein
VLPCAHATYARQHAYCCARRAGIVVHVGVCRYCPDREPAPSTGDPQVAILTEIAATEAALARMTAAHVRPCELVSTRAHLDRLRAQLAALPAKDCESNDPAGVYIRKSGCSTSPTNVEVEVEP